MELEPGYKQTEIGVIPDDWQTMTLGSLLSYEQPTPFLVVSTDYLEFSSVPVLTAGKTFILGYTDEEHGVYSSLPVILFDDFTTACQWVDFPFKVKSSAAKILSGRVGVSDTKFMHEYLSRLSYVPSDHQRHWISVFSSIEVFVPPLMEQKAIAEALSDVDALIDSLEALLTKKRNIKTGVMQELLTGRTRLPGFTGDWKEVRLGAFAEIVMGQSPDSQYYNLEGHGLPLIQGNADIKNRKSIARVWSSVASKKAKTGDVLLTVRAPVGAVAIASQDVCLGRGVCALSPMAGDIMFLYHSLFTNESKWKVLEQGSTFTAANSKQVSDFLIDVPQNIVEQKAIANVLSDIDDEIQALEKRLAKTRDLKQGMAQELLTGKTRLV